VTFDQQSSGSTSSERWRAVSQASFIVNSSTTMTGTYYDQLQETFAASIAAGGNTMGGTVNAHYTQFANGGASSLAFSDAASASDFADPGSIVTFDQQSSGSTSTERWRASQSSFAVNNSGTVTGTYYDQLKETFAVNIATGGNLMGGTVN